jgi:hypothetical protein
MTRVTLEHSTTRKLPTTVCGEHLTLAPIVHHLSTISCTPAGVM